jgi:hypothetical protein
MFASLILTQHHESLDRIIVTPHYTTPELEVLLLSCESVQRNAIDKL